MKIILQKIRSYNWIKVREIYFRGYFFINNIMYSEEKAARIIEILYKEDKLLDSLKNSFNGFFSFIITVNNNDCIFCVDHVGSMPLFYTQKEEFFLSDDANSLISSFDNIVVENIAENYYLASSLFVPGELTLIKGLYRCEAGTIYRVKNNKVNKFRYFHINHKEFNLDKDTKIKDNLWKAYYSAGYRLVKVLNGRTAIVPLSGGADSRMIVDLLKHFNYKNVVCFTYGIENSLECRISKIVADSYGFKWVLAPYNGSMWRKLRSSKILDDYYNYAFNYSSTPHIQDFPAVQFLIENSIIPQNGVFVPGHSGDLLAGSHITNEYLDTGMRFSDFIESIISKFFPDRKLANQSINKILNEYLYLKYRQNYVFANEIEWFNIKERQSKYIINSVRAYEFFGFEWILPLWDLDIVHFWEHIPLSLRYNRRLYFSIIKSHIKSTNDETLYKKVGVLVRKIPVIKHFVRIIARMKRYYKSPLMIERFIPMLNYLSECIKNPTLVIPTLTSRMILKKLKDEIKVKQGN